MQKQQFDITINAPREKVWEALWNLDNYREWTSAFAEGSTAETDGWKKGSKVLFLDAKKQGGMVAYIEDNVPGRFMSFRHVGIVSNGVEDTTSEKVKEWAGAHEDYHLEEKDNATSLVIKMDINAEYADYFKETWPKALQKVKTIAERNS